MDDPYSPVPSGTRGTVNAVDDIGQIHMSWDNDRSLALVPGIDSFRKLTAKELEEEQHLQMNPSERKTSLDQQMAEAEAKARKFTGHGTEPGIDGPDSR